MTAAPLTWTFEGMRPEDMSREDLIRAVGQLGQDLAAERASHEATSRSLGVAIRHRCAELSRAAG